MIDQITQTKILVGVKWRGQTVDMLTAYCGPLSSNDLEMDNIDEFEINPEIKSDPLLRDRQAEVEAFIDNHYRSHKNESFIQQYRLFCDITTKQYRSTRHNFNEQVDNIVRFKITVSMLTLCITLLLMKLISLEVAALASVILFSTILQCVVSWLRPVHFYKANNDNHKQVIITNQATLLAQNWPATPHSSPIRNGMTPFPKLREIIADVLLSSPYGKQSLMCDIEDMPQNSASLILKQALEASPLQNIQNNTPLLSPFIWLVRNLLEATHMNIHKPKALPSKAIDPNHAPTTTSRRPSEDAQTLTLDQSQSNRV